MKPLRTACLLAAALAAGCDSGPPPPDKIPVKPETFEQRWKAADADKDGKLSRAEASKGYTKGVAANFDRIDTNKDGFVTREERERFQKQQKAKE